MMRLTKVVSSLMIIGNFNLDKTAELEMVPALVESVEKLCFLSYLMAFSTATHYSCLTLSSGVGRRELKVTAENHGFV